jgi:hypothetical protein
LRAKLIFALLSLSVNIYSQVNYSICKIDTSNERVFIFVTRQYLDKLDNVSKLVQENENRFKSYKDLKISFYDNFGDCGYQIDKVIEINDSIVDIKVNDVSSHWFAEYSRKSGEIEYFKSDGSLEVERKFHLKKE